jgi:hypothetical protein
MYSYGSSARAGMGKRGHGGRNYRPPPERHKNGEMVPPPMKACNCLVQLDLPEYMQTANRDDEVSDTVSNRRRLHTCFPGTTIEERRKSIQNIEKLMRSRFAAHLVIPGRTQSGPVGIVGKTYREALPAVACFLQQLVLNSSTENEYSQTPILINGRIQRNVKDPDDVTIEGRWQHRALQSFAEGSSKHPLDPYMLFQSHQNFWNVMTCDLEPPTASSIAGETADTAPNTTFLDLLKTCVDNVTFRLGNNGLRGVDIFFYQIPPINAQIQQSTVVSVAAFAAGHPDQVDAVFQEIRQVKL